MKNTDKDKYSNFEFEVNVIGRMLRNMQKLPSRPRGYEKLA